jgi:D-tyrosyl-tRNA(Tyr) deacylase
VIACLQRVASASVEVAGEVVGSIGAGLLVLLGVAKGDGVAEADRLAERVAGCRCFPSADGSKPIDRSVLDLGLEILVVSQFTLCADTRKGMRPGFDGAAPPAVAEPLYQRFVAGIERQGVRHVATGRFGASMRVALVNDGPVTLLVEQRPLGPAST